MYYRTYINIYYNMKELVIFTGILFLILLIIYVLLQLNIIKSLNRYYWSLTRKQLDKMDNIITAILLIIIVIAIILSYFNL